MREVVITTEDGKQVKAPLLGGRVRKRTPPPVEAVKLSEIEEIVSFHKLRANARLTDGKVVKISRELALKFATKNKANKLRYLPKGCTEIDTTVKVEDIAAVLFRYALVSLVSTNDHRKVYVPRELADQFSVTADDFVTRGVNQPWNDRRTFDDISNDSIFEVIRWGKNTCRVLTFDGNTVLVTRARAERYETWKKEEEPQQLVADGLKMLTEEAT